MAPKSEQQLPPYTDHARRTKKSFLRLRLVVLAALTGLVFLNTASYLHLKPSQSSHIPIHAAETLQKCQNLHTKPGPPPDFNLRTESDRFAHGTRATLIKNASIWTGGVKGLEVVEGDLLLDKGLIKGFGKLDSDVLMAYTDLVTFDARGAWVTPGIVDMHSHLGVDSVPELDGAADTNSMKGITQPWLRSIDALNTHDEAYRLSISGGVTTANILPGSANAIGGQAFPIKLRPTKERSSASKLLEPPYFLNGSDYNPSLPPRWRQMKHACGENPSNVYSGTRLDTAWSFRDAYNTAKGIKDSQDEYCSKAVAGEWDGLGKFPENLQWEALVDVLRGHVKVHVHCYEEVDLTNMVRLSNEFKFPIAAFHHASEAYLVPDLLKQTYDHTPAIALFATNSRYKREAYRGSEFAPRILSDEGLKVVMKSDHPVLDSRYLLFEAQQAHYYGMPSNLALASVISTPAEVLGQDHRIGFIKNGYDADIVVWDSHPLALGATPKQVWIDGIAQLESPYSSEKPASFQKPPVTPNFDKETYEAIKHEGLPPLKLQSSKSEIVIFTNVSNIFVRSKDTIHELFSGSADKSRTVVVKDGVMVCDGSDSSCDENYKTAGAEYVNLEAGSLSPGLLSFGSPLAIDEIEQESSSWDGPVYDLLDNDAPDILDGTVIRAADGLQFQTRDALLAYHSGVVAGISAPSSEGFLSGLSVAFATGASHKLEHGAVLQDATALHVHLSHGYSTTASVGTQVATLRKLLLGQHVGGDVSERFSQVADGTLPLVVSVESADIMASLITLKQEVESHSRKLMKMTFVGGAEAHIIAEQIGLNGVGVILVPSRSFPASWEGKRILPGLPLSQDSVVAALRKHNITVGLGVLEPWMARNTRFDVAWAALDANGDISRADALALASVNLEKLLGLRPDPMADWVATRGGTLLDFESRVAAVISPRRGVVDLV